MVVDGPRVALADYRGADPTGVPASLAKASLVERGEYLARAADCMVCHTVPGGKPYAGGLAFKLPFGTLYSTNITPDKDTGIANYSDRQFLDAVQRGVRRDGARPMPFAAAVINATLPAKRIVSPRWLSFLAGQLCGERHRLEAQ